MFFCIIFLLDGNWFIGSKINMILCLCEYGDLFYTKMMIRKVLAELLRCIPLDSVYCCWVLNYFWECTIAPSYHKWLAIEKRALVNWQFTGPFCNSTYRLLASYAFPVSFSFFMSHPSSIIINVSMIIKMWSCQNYCCYLPSNATRIPHEN